MKYIFRAYDPDTDDFVYSDRDYDGAAWFEFRDGVLKAFVLHEKDYGPPEDSLVVRELEPPEMWTGLKDKFDISIFGGDNCKATHPDDQHYYEGYIIYEDELSCFCLRHDTGAGYGLSDIPLAELDEIEIIGNTHQTKSQEPHWCADNDKRIVVAENSNNKFVEIKCLGDGYVQSVFVGQCCLCGKQAGN